MGSGNWVDRDALFDQRVDRKWESFSWLTVRALLSSVNDVIGKGAPRLVNDLRQQWVAAQRKAAPHGRWDDDFVIRRPGVTSFLLLGDPGEQDFSQYVVVPVLASQDDADFMLVMSDVIYPSGDVNDYVDGFYIPYRPLALPIYAQPGNHDWYDGLNGFMWNLCGAEPLPPDAYDVASYSPRERLARRLWKKASAPRRDILEAYRDERAPQGQAWEPLQPGPYFAMDLGELLVVCVDSGITGDIDREQAQWLVRVSDRFDKPKLMLVGRPLVDKRSYRPGPFPAVAGLPVKARDGTTFATVDDVVRHEPFRYVAAIGGDTHNFQRYDVTLPSAGGARRRFHYVVSGGGGAYMSETHTIADRGPLAAAPQHAGAAAQIELTRFESYPTRADSLIYFAALAVPRLWRIVVGTMLALGGVAAVALVILLAEPGRDALDTACLVGAVGLGLALALVFLWPGEGSRSVEPSSRRRLLTYAAWLATGAVACLAAWWLEPDRFGTHILVAAVVAGGMGVIAALLRITGVWRIRVVSRAVLLGQLLAVVAALALFELDDADPVHVLVLVPLAVLLPAPALMAVDRLRVVLGRRRYKRAVLGVVALTAVVGVLVLDAAWGRALATVAVITVFGLLISAVAHLHFLAAFRLLARPSWRDGALDADAARQVLAWRAGEPRPVDVRTRGIANMVYPGSDAPRGPLQRFVSEIFDKNEPPLFKNFLRVDLAPGRLTITCLHATGREDGPQDVTSEEPIEIDLGAAGRRAAA
jgi:hypothetical protein